MPEASKAPWWKDKTKAEKQELIDKTLWIKHADPTRPLVPDYLPADYFEWLTTPSGTRFDWRLTDKGLAAQAKVIARREPEP